MGESIALLKSSMEQRIVGKGQLIDNVIAVCILSMKINFCFRT